MPEGRTRNSDFKWRRKLGEAGVREEEGGASRRRGR